MERDDVGLSKWTQVIPVDLSWSVKTGRVYSGSDTCSPDDELLCSEVWEDLAFAACS